jgi:hypothetical protein
MKQSRILVVAGGLLALLIPLREASAQSLPGPENYKLRLEGFSWGTSIEGQIQKGFGSTPGTLLDLTDDLAVGDKRTYGGDATIQFKPGWKLRGSYAKIDYAGDTGARQNFSFGQDQYFVGDRVVTAIQGRYYTAALEWDFVKKPQGYLGIFVGAKLLDGDFVLVSPGTNKRDVESGVGGLPVVGISTRFYSGQRFSAQTEYSGMTIGSRGSVWELDLSARFHLSDRLAAMGGYHKLNLKGEPTKGRDFVDVKLSGITFGLELSL